MFNKWVARRTGLLLGTLMATLLTALIGYWLMHRLQTESVHTVQHSLNAWTMIVNRTRWAMMVFVFLSWNALVTALVNAGVSSTPKAAQLRALRWRAVTWLVVLELVVGQGVLIQAGRLLAGTGL